MTHTHFLQLSRAALSSYAFFIDGVIDELSSLDFCWGVVCTSRILTRWSHDASGSSCLYCSCYRQGDRAASLSNFPRSRVPQKRRLVVEKSSCCHCSCYRQESRAAPLSNFPRTRVPQKRRLVVVEEKCRCRHCSCYRQEDRAASLSNFTRVRVPQKERLVVDEGDSVGETSALCSAMILYRVADKFMRTWSGSAAVVHRPLSLAVSRSPEIAHNAEKMSYRPGF